jgi:hypothetical protein
MNERKGIITIQGNPLTLIGPELKVGDRAPDFVLLDGELKEFRLKDAAGMVKVISVTPSLDTPVCDMQARRFNQEASRLGPDIIVMNVSMDLPFSNFPLLRSRRHREGEGFFRPPGGNLRKRLWGPHQRVTASGTGGVYY